MKFGKTRIVSLFPPCISFNNGVVLYGYIMILIFIEFSKSVYIVTFADIFLFRFVVLL